MESKKLTKEALDLISSCVPLSDEEIKGMKGLSRTEAKRCVGKGWGKLIDQAYDIFDADVCVTQVKEKFGSLRIYVFNASSEINDKLRKIMDYSLKVCENCGKRGQLRDMAWILTLCDKCYKEYLEKRKT